MYTKSLNFEIKFLSSGLFRDVFGTFDEAFYVGAAGVFLGGCVLACGNTWKICREQRAKRAAKEAENEALHDNN